MKKYFISIEINLGDDDATAYYTRLANEAALNEMRKTKVTATQADYAQDEDDAEPFNDVAEVTEVTDEEIAVLKKFGLDHVSIGSILLSDEDGMESDVPFESYSSDDNDALLNYVPDAE